MRPQSNGNLTSFDKRFVNMETQYPTDSRSPTFQFATFDWICRWCSLLGILFIWVFVSKLVPIGSMYGIYANIWGILMANVSIYSSTMDPMGYGTSAMKVDHFLWKAVLDFPPAGQPRSPEAQPGDLGREKKWCKDKMYCTLIQLVCFLVESSGNVR